LFAALARRDRAALERLVAPDLVLRIPGQPDADRTALLQGIAAAPGDILEVTGEQLRAHDAGDTGIVEGIQLSQVLRDLHLELVVQLRGMYSAASASAFAIIFSIGFAQSAA